MGNGISNPNDSSWLENLFLSKEKENELIKVLKEYIRVGSYKGRSLLEDAELIIKNIENINYKDDEGNTALHLACKIGSEKICKELINKGANINIKNSSGRTPLLLAYKNNNVKTVSFLLKKNAEITENSANKLLFWGCENGYEKIVTQVLKRPNVDVNTVKDNNKTLLKMTCMGSYPAIVKLLLNHPKINLNQFKLGEELLLWACDYDYALIIEKLLSKGVNPNIRNNHDQTPLIMCYYHIAIVKLLIKANANPNLTDSNGDTLLHLACRYDRVNVIKFLLDQPNVNIDKANNNSRTPLLEILNNYCFNNRPNTIKLILKLDKIKFGRELVLKALEIRDGEILKQLLQKDIKLTQKDKNIVIQEACKRGWVEIVELYLKNGFDVNHADEEGNTLLHDALASKHSKDMAMVKLLLQYGADVNQENKHGEASIYSACRFSNTEFRYAFVILLLQYGASVKRGYECCFSPLYWALHNKDKDLKFLLILHGALEETSHPKFSPSTRFMNKFHAFLKELLAKSKTSSELRDKLSYFHQSLFPASVVGLKNEVRRVVRENRLVVNVTNDDQPQEKKWKLSQTKNNKSLFFPRLLLNQHTHKEAIDNMKTRWDEFRLCWRKSVR